MTEKRIIGTAVSTGIRIGIAKVFIAEPIIKSLNEDEFIEEALIESELESFNRLKQKINSDLEELVQQTKSALGEEEAGIFIVQQELLNDPTFYAEIKKAITNNCYSLRKAIRQVMEKLIQQFSSIDDRYFQERVIDMKDLEKRLLTHKINPFSQFFAQIDETSVIIANELTPSETIQLSQKNVKAFITKAGGETSHSVILARSLNIPMIINVQNHLDWIEANQTIIVDGYSGTIIIEPEANTLQDYQKKIVQEKIEQQNLLKFRKKKAITKDDYLVHISANVGNINDVKSAVTNGAEGVGLLRTEFLFLENEQYPTEEEQFHAYKQVISEMKDTYVTIRTFDFGGDKNLPYLDLPDEANPFLGYRAIRISLDQKDLFYSQLRAIIRASIYGKVKIMFPMITSLEEIKASKRIYHEVIADLEKEGIPFAKDIKLGIMLEVPSAVLLMEQFTREVDFFSIGTNDLIQYTLAVDRTNDKVSYLYDCFHPAIIKLIKMAADVAHKNDKDLSICGFMASNHSALPILIGLGIRELSANVNLINKLKQSTTKLNYEACRILTEELLTLGSTGEIKQRLIASKEK